MYLQNLQLEPLDYNVLQSELLNDVVNEPVPTLAEVKDTLAQMYLQASEATAMLYYQNLESFKKAKAASFSIAVAGFNLWERLRKFLCTFLSATSTTIEIIDKVVEFMASFIPGGIFISALVKKLVSYVLNIGYEKPCLVGS